MNARRSDRRIVILLCLALVAEVCALLWHLGIGPAGKLNRVGAEPAGYVAQQENDVRRRGLNSLIWEESSHQDTVYFYDSLLTLSRSTARIRLAQNSEIHLSENTLVTIEPTDEEGRGEIRLRFNKGGMRARNAERSARIDADDVSVKVVPGSDVQLRQVNEGELEVRVTAGEALVARSGEAGLAVAVDQVVRMGPEGAESLVVDSGWQWIDPPASRIYSHQDEVEVQLKWSGAAEKLVLQALGQAEEVRELKDDQRNLSLHLPLGNYSIYLRAESRVSEPLMLQIWSAPVLHLVAPLPRNRIRLGEAQDFIWTRIGEAESYEWRWGAGQGQMVESTPMNVIRKSFATEENAHWEVWAKDREGHWIPPLYRYPIYVRESPLAAPKLKAPTLRKPAGTQRGAWLRMWNWVMPMAHAEPSAVYEAEFAWEAVDGADRYWLEISETPDFRKPILSRQVTSTYFVYSGLGPRRYYWRVASGAAARMGLFSEPAELNLEQVKLGAGDVDGVKIKALPQEAPANPVVPPIQPVPTPVVPVEPEVLVTRPQQTRPSWSVLWRPAWTTMNFNLGRQTNVDLSGWRWAAAEVHGGLGKSFLNSWRWELSLDLVRYRPEPEVRYPFQDELNSVRSHVALIKDSTESRWLWGFEGVVLDRPERSADEAVRLNSAFGVGPRIGQRWGESWPGEWTASLLGTQMGFGTRVRFQQLHRLGSAWGIGLQSSGEYLTNGSHVYLGWSAGLILRFDLYRQQDQNSHK